MLRYFIIDSDRVVAEDLTEQDLIDYAYAKWSEDDIKTDFEEPDDITTSRDYLEYYYRIIAGRYIC